MRWGCPWDASTMDIMSCCYPLPTVLLHRRASATTAVRGLQQQQGLLPENDVSKKHHLWVRRQFAYQAALPLPPSKNPDDGGIASLPAIPAVALSFSPPDSSLRLAARSRWSPKRLAAQTLPFFPHQASWRVWPCSNTADP